jgi:isoquinoline 1-oxidoreductase alpha subunit
MMYTFNVNGKKVEVDVPHDTPLLWVLRDNIGLRGTKYGCGIGICGCCTVHIDGEPVQSCGIAVSSVSGKNITTIEGLATQKDHPLLKAWFEENVSQCGYCQPGQIMTAAALLQKNPNPSDNDINNAMSSNLCRCGTYQRIRKAIHRAAMTLDSNRTL